MRAPRFQRPGLPLKLIFTLVSKCTSAQNRFVIIIPFLPVDDEFDHQTASRPHGHPSTKRPEGTLLYSGVL